MPTKTPSSASLPPILNTQIHPPPSSNPNASPSPNILVLLHTFGDTASNLSRFAAAINLPETTCLTVQGPFDVPPTFMPLNAGTPMKHWADEIQLPPDASNLNLNSAGPFHSSTKLIADSLISKVLIKDCGYNAREILLLGHGQGASVALAAAYELGKEQNLELGGVVSFGGVLPPSTATPPRQEKKLSTPILVQGGSEDSELTDAAVARTQAAFEHVEIQRFQKAGDTMPANRNEVLPMMRFFGRRLRSRKGIPEGAVEIGT